MIQYTTRITIKVNLLFNPKGTLSIILPNKGASAEATITIPGNIWTHKSHETTKPHFRPKEFETQSSGPPFWGNIPANSPEINEIGKA